MIILYTLLQFWNIILILMGAWKGYKLGHIANLVDEYEHNDLLQFHLQKEDPQAAKPLTGFSKIVADFDDLSKGDALKEGGEGGDG